MKILKQALLAAMFACLASLNVTAQGTEPESQPTDYLTKEFHAGRRQALRDLMPANSVTVVFAYPERVFSKDVNYVYHPNPDMYYFSGYKEPDACLLIFKEMQTDAEGSYNEVMFVRRRDPSRESWTGRRLGAEGVKSKLGFNRVYVSTEFEKLVIDFKKFSEVISDRLPDDAGGDLKALVANFKGKMGTTNTADFATFTGVLRGIKTPEELVLLKKSVEISSIAHAEAMRAVTPKMSERELEGIMLYVHKKYGAEDEGYPPIVGAGANGCILHYEENNSTEIKNQLVLMDVGAEYHGYSADVTRTFPANGRFTEEQKAIYQIVYDAQEEVFKLCHEGTKSAALNAKASEVLAAGLIKLGIIKTAAELRTYYGHSVTHQLGLDVHDKGVRGSDLKAGMVLTNEPGLYIPAGSPCDKKWWNIGVRIEDDILIGKTEGTWLSIDAPRKWQDVEKTIAEKSIFDAVKLPALK
jgi:Xaa-Pro aminopeptidase